VVSWTSLEIELWMMSEIDIGELKYDFKVSRGSIFIMPPHSLRPFIDREVREFAALYDNI
jgi:hypothetical protein